MSKEKIILTGDRPTGRLHIGHYVGSLRRRVELQNSGLYDNILGKVLDSEFQHQSYPEYYLRLILLLQS